MCFGSLSRSPTHSLRPTLYYPLRPSIDLPASHHPHNCLLYIGFFFLFVICGFVIGAHEAFCFSSQSRLVYCTYEIDHHYENYRVVTNQVVQFLSVCHYTTLAFKPPLNTHQTLLSVSGRIALEFL